MLPAMFGWNWNTGSGEDFFLIFVNLFLVFRDYLPLEQAWPIISPKDALCQVWLKLVQWFWRRRFLNFLNVFSLFRNYLLLEKGVVLYLNKFEFPLPKDSFCVVWLNLTRWFWRWRWKCEKFMTMDRLWSEKLNSFGSGDLRIKINKTFCNFTYNNIYFKAFKAFAITM